MPVPNLMAVSRSPRLVPNPIQCCPRMTNAYSQLKLLLELQAQPAVLLASHQNSQQSWYMKQTQNNSLGSPQALNVGSDRSLTTKWSLQQSIFGLKHKETLQTLGQVLGLVTRLSDKRSGVQGVDSLFLQKCSTVDFYRIGQTWPPRSISTHSADLNPSNAFQITWFGSGLECARWAHLQRHAKHVIFIGYVLDLIQMASHDILAPYLISLIEHVQ